MLKVIVIVCSIIFFLTSTAIVFYWRDANYVPDAADLIFNFVLIPLGLSCIILLPYFLYKAVLKRRDQSKNVDRSEDKVEQQRRDLDVEPQIIPVHLKVYSGHVCHALGWDETMIESMIQLQAPCLDPRLSESLGTSILSYRIEDLDDLIQDQLKVLSPDQSPSDTASLYHLRSRLDRIENLIQLQLNQHVEEVLAISEHIKRSKQYYHSKHAQYYEMHPAWKDAKAAIKPHREEIYDHVVQLDQLNIHIILPEHVMHCIEEYKIEQRIEQYFQELDIDLDTIDCRIDYMSPQNHLLQWQTLMQQLSLQEYQCSLCIVVDSEIDADYINERLSSGHNYVASEFSASLIMSSIAQNIDGLEQYRNLAFSVGAQSIQKMLETFSIDLEQYKDEKPYVVISEANGQIKTLRMLKEALHSSPFETYHQLYAQSALGNAQSLSKLFSFILTSQLDPLKHTLFYSGTQLAMQAIFIPQQVEENVDV